MSETFILFTIADTTYALRSREVAHVEMIETITPVPNAAAFVDGVVFSRGSVVAAMNFACGSDSTARHTICAPGCWSCCPAAGASGLIVDAAREFLSFDEAAIHPAGIGLSGRYLEGVVNIGNRLILVLNLAEVLSFDNPTLAATGRAS